ncbi:MAG: outer membrane lipoprotein carrier protein LolA [Armatimonadetes bacterium]|nr:outer membrane lipoprotein carrier protein LolA [Armatimonadota bacterium]
MAGGLAVGQSTPGAAPPAVQVAQDARAPQPRSQEADAQVRGPSPVALLVAALQAPAVLDYEGTRVITATRNGRMETVTVAEMHKRPNRWRFQYLSPEGLAGRLVIDDGATTWHYEPAVHMVFRSPSQPRQPRDETTVHQLLREHVVLALGVEEVIGRPAYLFSLQPRGTGSTRRIWVDQATGTVLRREDSTPQDGTVYSSYFTRISFSLNLPEAMFRFQAPSGARVVSIQPTQGPLMPLGELRRRVGFRILAPLMLPQGYTYRGGTLARDQNFASAHLIYSDGVNALSIYQTRARSMTWPQQGQVTQVRGRPARLVDAGNVKVLMWEYRDLRITAVGAVPVADLLTLAGEMDEDWERASLSLVGAQTGQPEARVALLRDQGLTFWEVVQVLALSRALRRDPEEVAGAWTPGARGETLAQRLRVPPQQVDDVLRQVGPAVDRLHGLPRKIRDAAPPAGVPASPSR